MNKKIFFTASAQSHLEHFHQPYIKAFEEAGWEVTARALPVKKHFLSPKNLLAVWSTRRFIKDEKFSVISTHTTLAGIVARLAVLLSGKNRRNVLVFHTAHGYLFHDDHSFKKWAYLIPEILCARVTDVLMVMNREDLAIAEKYRLCKNKDNIYYINGIGIDLARFHPVQPKSEQRSAFGLKEGDFTFVYAAAFSKRKNHRLLLQGFAKALREWNGPTEGGRLNGASGGQLNGASQGDSGKKPPLRLALAGDGALAEEMKELSRSLGISDHVNFLGHVSGMQELYSCCQAAVTTSRIEGLPFNVMEAVCCGLPVIASDIKGHRELITHKVNGLLFEDGNAEQLACRILELLNDPELLSRCKANGISGMEAFSIDKVLPSIMKIYQKHIPSWGGIQQ